MLEANNIDVTLMELESVGALCHLSGLNHTSKIRQKRGGNKTSASYKRPFPTDKEEICSR